MRGLWSVVLEVFREMFELDSRLFRTLKSLLFKPGHLSSEFSRNRRASYMSPVRLYLFISFVFFLVLSISAGGWLRNLDLSDADVQMGGSGDDPAAADSALAVTDSVLAAVDSALAGRGLPAGLGLGALVDSVLADSTLTADTRADSAVGQAIDPVQLEDLKARLLPEHARKVDDIMGRPGNPPAKQVVRGLAGSVDPDERVSGVPAWLIRYGRGLLIDLFHDPRAFLQEAIGNLPIAMFFLLPFLALALALCYFRKKRFFIEHLVFGMHNQTFTFLCLAAALLVPVGSVARWFQLFLVFTPQVYYLVALRRYYGDGWIRTLVKGFAVWWLYMAFLLPGFFVVLFLTA